METNMKIFLLFLSLLTFSQIVCASDRPLNYGYPYYVREEFQRRMNVCIKNNNQNCYQKCEASMLTYSKVIDRYIVRNYRPPENKKYEIDLTEIYIPEIEYFNFGRSAMNECENLDGGSIKMPEKKQKNPIIQEISMVDTVQQKEWCKITEANQLPCWVP